MADESVSWSHFGDLRSTAADEPNYRAFLLAIEETKLVIASSIEFTPQPGDSDVGRRSLDSLRAHQAPEPYRGFAANTWHLASLNSVSEWRPRVFGPGAEQLERLRAVPLGEMAEACGAGA